MIQFNFESTTSVGKREPYNNVAAHEELKSMMSRPDRLNIFFDIDKDGYEIIKVESTCVKRFSYQLNDKSANWLMRYLSTGKSATGDILSHLFSLRRSSFCGASLVPFWMCSTSISRMLCTSVLRDRTYC